LYYGIIAASPELLAKEQYSSTVMRRRP